MFKKEFISSVKIRVFKGEGKIFLIKQIFLSVDSLFFTVFGISCYSKATSTDT